ncbi:uncharacterized protein LOC113359253 [Papaver somniferum]|uniref:uncharacterized protein LOC113359253 n=1 Tax=Papaver somniferum TaxID=3469 RepID=UPI000E7042A2|nr:uncharacterized protein LOC113359253 [Papaver somniferum]
MDVKSAFLNGILEEELYVEQPDGYIEKVQENCHKLHKSLYGLKQEPHTWYTRIDTYFINNDFEKCPCEHTLYMKTDSQNNMIILCLYVDDLIFLSNNNEMVKEFMEAMIREFEMTDLGLMSYFLGLEVLQPEDGIFVSQQRYAKEILKRFKMNDCKPILTPVESRLKLTKEGTGELVNPTDFKCLLGSLRYLISTRPDIVFGVRLFSRFMESPKQSHLQAAKSILRYICGTIDYGIFYNSTETMNLVEYTDNDWVGDIEERKSTSGFAFDIGSGYFSWSSKKQQVVALCSFMCCTCSLVKKNAEISLS